MYHFLLSSQLIQDGFQSFRITVTLTSTGTGHRVSSKDYITFLTEHPKNNEFKVPDVVSVDGKLNLTEKFKKSAKYDLLKYIGQRVIDNIDIGKHSYIQLKLEPAEFRNSSELLKKSKFLSL